MTSSEYLQQREPDLSKWWSEVTADPRFDKVMLIASSDIIAMKDPLKISGATETLESLKQMAYVDPRTSVYPTPGTVHEFSKG